MSKESNDSKAAGQLSSTVSLDSRRFRRRAQACFKSQIDTMSPGIFRSWSWALPGFGTANTWIEEHPLRVRSGRYMSDTPGKEVWCVELPETFDSRKVVCKYHEDENRSFYGLFRHSTAVLEAANFAALKALGVPVPTVLACGEKRHFGELVSSFIITDFIENTVDGSILLPTGDWCDRKRLRMGFCHKCMEYIARAHAAGFHHAAFHAHKILMPKHSDEDNPEVTLIDLAHGCFLPRRAMPRAIAIDLVTLFTELRLNSDEIHVLIQHYLDVNKQCDMDDEELWDAMNQLPL
jgi:tRNA A-37 threonylcarbamoyl transferase component Bud32